MNQIRVTLNISQQLFIMGEAHTERMEATTVSYYYQPEDHMCDTEHSNLNSDFKAAAFYMVFVLGLVGNITILWVLLKVMHLKTLTNVCLLNLALSDLLMVLSLPIWALYTQGHYLTGNAMCKVIAGVYQVGLYSGILFVTLMSVDRYLVIVHAVAVLGAKMLRYGVVVSLIIWVVSIAAALPEVIYAAMVMEENTTSCQRLYPQESAQKWKLFRNFSENAVVLFISLPIIIYCYIRVLRVVQRTKNKKRDRAIKLILAIVAVFMVFWVPYNVVVFLKTLQEFGILNSCTPFYHINMAMDLTEMIALTHCCINPVIYAFVGEKFRKCLASVFTKCLRCAKIYQFDSLKTQSNHSKVSENDTSNTGF
ncbi:C-C chemokine receptor type 8 [Paramisgurnus dabryanus]|uniref:C-C chemokine receptor type 8 n=1 Tax=Paramisgurnus dabryanus TaxID=90735 RepID=UPI003CCF101A